MHYCDEPSQKKAPGTFLTQVELDKTSINIKNIGIIFKKE